MYQFPCQNQLKHEDGISVIKSVQIFLSPFFDRCQMVVLFIIQKIIHQCHWQWNRKMAASDWHAKLNFHHLKMFIDENYLLVTQQYDTTLYNICHNCIHKIDISFFQENPNFWSFTSLLSSIEKRVSNRCVNKIILQTTCRHENAIMIVQTLYNIGVCGVGLNTRVFI